MKKTMISLMALLAVSSVAKADALDSDMEPLKLETPVMEMKLSGTTATTYRPELELPMAPLVGRSEKYQLTWMRTNPDVKPYKVMDDLTFTGVPLFVAGIIAKGEKKSFRQNSKDNRHTLVTDFKSEIDNYTQFFGPVMATGLKIAGVEGRSDWGRYLSSAAMSYGFMALFVNSIKYTAKELRPDGSTRNSWPSGHTATAFVGATILHKEYGVTRSPWYSVAGYGVATATGVMRVLNNRHWVSDVLSGAGVGIISGELGYAMSDLIFKGKGLLRGDALSERSIIDHPSFFSISMGLGLGSKNLDFDMSRLGLTDFDGDKVLNLKFGSSTVVGAEGAYFFNKYIGVGGRLRVYSSPIKGWDGIENYAWNDLVESLYGDDYSQDADFRRFIDGDETSGPLIEDAYFTIKSDHLTEFSADLGLYFNVPLSRRLALGSKLLVGRSIMQEVDLNATVTGNTRSLDFEELMGGLDDDNLLLKAVPSPGKYTSEYDYFTLGGNNTMKFGTGLSLTYAYKENYAWRVFVDYDYSHKTYTMTYNPAIFVFDAINVSLGDMKSPISSIMEPQDFAEMAESHQIKKNRHTFVIGGSLTISF